jgi:hypothetical protein
VRELGSGRRGQQASAFADHITERDFQAQVLELAHLCGWLAYHTWTSVHSPSGYPDLTLARAPRVIFAELKSQRGRVTPAQCDWLEELRRCPGTECYLWRPSDFAEISRVLAR